MMNRRRLSVSSWSLHQSLGAMPITGPADEANGPASAAAKSLLDLPREIAKHGIGTLEICHFHLASTESDYLAQVRKQLEENRVELWSLLIDGGDLNGDYAERDFEWIRAWIEVAGRLGARNARVITGKGQPNDKNLSASIAHLSQLVEVADKSGVRLMTENWFATLGTPEAVHRVFDELKGQIDLCLDFGNWHNATNYSDLASIAPYATSCHARADFGPSGQLDETDFRRCLELSVAADFHGPFTLIPSGRLDHEWVAINEAARVTREYCE
jgi:sugar phosphate isomerase/epimerase